MNDFKDLTVYKKAFALAMEIFEISKKFPKEETYSLTDQIRRASHSVCANLGEGYRKRHYPKHFVSKISDSDMENSETQVWLDFAFHCKYIDKGSYKNLIRKSEEVGRLLNHMIINPEKYQRKTKSEIANC
ncbi:MAG: diversity-generating retroelement protein bAvd family protein [Bacteroidetes bacterium]|nr:MAG: diversity-generating retroelement protein bAvd family protein [Bacteroidota bacterium]